MKHIWPGEDFAEDLKRTCVCTVCHGFLRISGEEIQCSQCSRSFSILDGIPDFTSDIDLPNKVRELGDLYDRASLKHSGSPRSCGYSGNAACLSSLNIFKRWIDVRETGGNRILDIGCGTGLVSEELVKRNDVWGVDVSVELSKMATGKGLKVLLASAHNLPFRDRDFDLVLCMGVIPYYRKPKRIFSEASRVTKRGGRIIVSSTANSLVIRFVRTVKRSLGISSKLERLYTCHEIEKYLMNEGAMILDSCLGYDEKVWSLNQGRQPLNLKFFSRNSAVLATFPKSHQKR